MVWEYVVGLSYLCLRVNQVSRCPPICVRIRALRVLTHETGFPMIWNTLEINPGYVGDFKDLCPCLTYPYCVGFSDNFLTDPGCVGCSDKSFCVSYWPRMCGVFRRNFVLSYWPQLYVGFSESFLCVSYSPLVIAGFSDCFWLCDWYPKMEKRTVLDCFSLPGN